MRETPAAPSPVVFVVDDDDLARRSCERLFRASGFAVESFPSAVHFMARLPIHGEACVVTDLRMPEMSGLALQQAASRRDDLLPFIFLTGCGTVSDAVQAMKNGAIDFLEKPVEPRALLAAVSRALATAAERRAGRSQREHASRLAATLTPRERQVCQLVCQGLLNKQIAAELGTSEKTVKTQRGRAARKLGAASAAALVDTLRKAGF